MNTDQHIPITPYHIEGNDAMSVPMTHPMLPQEENVRIPALTTVPLELAEEAEWGLLRRLSPSDLVRNRETGRLARDQFGEFLLKAKYTQRAGQTLLDRVVIPNGLARYLRSPDVQKRQWAWNQFEVFARRPGSTDHLISALLTVPGLAPTWNAAARVQPDRHDEIVVSAETWLRGTSVRRLWDGFNELLSDVRNANPTMDARSVIETAAAIVEGRGYPTTIARALVQLQLPEPLTWLLAQTHDGQFGKAPHTSRVAITRMLQQHMPNIRYQMLCSDIAESLRRLYAAG